MGLALYRVWPFGVSFGGAELNSLSTIVKTVSDDWRVMFTYGIVRGLSGPRVNAERHGECRGKVTAPIQYEFDSSEIVASRISRTMTRRQGPRRGRAD